MKLALHDEHALVERAKIDAEAFGLLFDSYYPILLRYTVRRVGDIASAEDIVADTFLKAMKALPKFQWRGVSIEAWLYAIATNEICSYFRQRRPIQSLEELYENQGLEVAADYDLAQEVESAQINLERQQLAMQAIQYMQQLPLLYQEVLILRYVEKKKVTEIAQILGKPEGTIKSLLSRGLAKLRKINTTQPFLASRVVDSEGRVTKVKPKRRI